MVAEHRLPPCDRPDIATSTNLHFLLLEVESKIGGGLCRTPHNAVRGWFGFRFSKPNQIRRTSPPLGFQICPNRRRLASHQVRSCVQTFDPGSACGALICPNLNRLPANFEPVFVQTRTGLTQGKGGVLLMCSTTRACEPVA